MENNILNLLKDRYFLDDEKTWNDLATRVSAIYPPSIDLIKEKVFIPSTPTLMNANTNGKREGTLSSCFTMGIDDSIEGIMDALKEAAIVTKAAGGVGYVFSNLRSSKEGIKGLNGRLSSGPIPFANMFNSVLDGVQQGGSRRGAGMFQYDITAPDILDIIRVKDKKGMLERFNISIRITDEFYSKLKEDPDFPHVVYFKDGTNHPLEDKGEIITVGKLWEEIIEYAWRCAEPGIFNVDTATRQCSVTNIDPIVLSNPCFTADTEIYTTEGKMNVYELFLRMSTNDEPTYVFSFNEETHEIEEKEIFSLDKTRIDAYIYELEFDDGSKIKLTPDHRVYTINRGWVEAKDLTEKDELVGI